MNLRTGSRPSFSSFFSVLFVAIYGEIFGNAYGRWETARLGWGVQVKVYTYIDLVRSHTEKSWSLTLEIQNISPFPGGVNETRSPIVNLQQQR